MTKKKVLLMTLALFAAIGSGSASAHWNYSDYSKGSYVPKSGDHAVTLYPSTNQLKTSIYFALDTNNVNSIVSYNNGNGGGDCSGSASYLTLDQTAVPDSWDLEISASVVSSNLPNPKYDLENDNYVAEYDESEVVALGTVSATNYYMATTWNDYRDGGAGDSGTIQGQFSMSKAGFSDYNNCIQSSAVQEYITYGDNLNSF
jgi:hypothetical protein